MSAAMAGVGQHVQQLLAVIERHRRRRCRELRERAEGEARELIAAAHAQARARVHADIVGTRRQLHEALAAAQARQRTRERRARQAAEERALAALRERLHGALLARWHEPRARREWVAAAVELAGHRLLAQDWRIEHAPDWPAPEQSEWGATLQAHGRHRVQFEPRAQIMAGLRVCSGDSCVDATLEALLRDGAAIDTLLLDLLQADAAAQGAQTGGQA